MEAEDFSFPAIAESCRFCIDSPPLWHVSSSSTPPSPSEAFNNTRETEHLKQGSLNEEKMDMLWEDFNEELLFMGMRNPNSNDAGSNSDDCSKEMVQFGCVKALAISKGNNGGNRSGVVAVLKVLRKMFLIHSSQRQLKKKKKHPW